MSVIKKAFVRIRVIAAIVILSGALHAFAQDLSVAPSELVGQILLPKVPAGRHRPDVVVWLEPLEQKTALKNEPGRFTLLQKNKMFSPHLLVIPVGSVVTFPNADPFFHNVFSLFNGKRFDLGLYETGSSKEVLFSRAGVSYIFCNIHPEMSAVVLALPTPLYAVADQAAKFAIHQIPAGDYDLHLWIEGMSQPALDRFSRRLHIRSDAQNTASIDASSTPLSTEEHLNKFGKPYGSDSKSTY